MLYIYVKENIWSFKFFDQYSLEGHSVSSNNKMEEKLQNTN